MSVHLTPKQAAAFRDLVQPMLGFLYRCKRRLEAKAFDKQSKLFRLVEKAYDAMHSLHLELHYISCGRGVGRSNDDRPGLTPPTDHAQAQPNQPDA
jgi:hypothetical protein